MRRPRRDTSVARFRSHCAISCAVISATGVLSPNAPRSLRRWSASPSIERFPFPRLNAKYSSATWAKVLGAAPGGVRPHPRGSMPAQDRRPASTQEQDPGVSGTARSAAEQRGDPSPAASFVSSLPDAFHGRAQPQSEGWARRAPGRALVGGLPRLPGHAEALTRGPAAGHGCREVVCWDMRS
jgi:hypothetical protein